MGYNDNQFSAYPPSVGPYANQFGQSHHHGNNQFGGMNAAVFSPRQHTLRPLHNLDSRVMRQFRNLERRDPRFKNTARPNYDAEYKNRYNDV